MQHLDLETIARLVDEAPEPYEAEHLRGCLVCRRELAEMRAEVEALGNLGEIDPPAGGWAALEARLMEEKLIGVPAAPSSARFLGLYRPPMRIAAALALFLLGGASGALLLRGMGSDAADARVAVDDAPAAEDAARPASRPSTLLDPELVIITEPAARPVAAAPAVDGSGARLAMNGGAAAEARRPEGVVPPERTAPRRATRAEANRAARELVQAQAEYVAALQRVAAIADPASGNDADTRLAALDQLVQLTASALERVPGDPVINGYHLAAVAERDALRREMAKDAATAWF
jgi:hypothetical protein